MSGRFVVNFKASDFVDGKLTERARLREQGRNPHMKQGHTYRARELGETLLRTGETIVEDNQMVVTLDRYS